VGLILLVHVLPTIDGCIQGRRDFLHAVDGTLCRAGQDEGQLGGSEYAAGQIVEREQYISRGHRRRAQARGLWVHARLLHTQDG